MDPALVAATAGRGAPLDEWIAAHGPIWPAAALVLTLDTCARASRMSDDELRRVIGSLNVSGIARRESGWSWVPTPSAASAYPVSDREILERLGAILFHALGGQPVVDRFADQQALRADLRNRRPDLSAQLTDLAVRAMSARHRPGLTLAAFARDVRQELGVEPHGDVRKARLLGPLAVVAAALMTLSGVWWSTDAGEEARVAAHGLSGRETAVYDIANETAGTFALIDEHTMAIQLYQQLGQLWRARLAPEDPRLAWNQTHEAWVRSLAGDRFTTRQLLEDVPDWLARELGETHPYTRVARLTLSFTLDPRGGDPEAVSLRDQAARALRELIHDTRRELDLSFDVPAAPGQLAHVAPNRPEREGFRRGPDGSSFVPLTSMQRLVAGRDGWRLHLIAADRCRASVVVGTVPRLITVSAARAADSSWEWRIAGTTPAITLRDRAAGRSSISLVASGSGSLVAEVADGTVESRIDSAGPTPDPPYGLSFASDRGDTGCAVVWLELPFPPRFP